MTSVLSPELFILPSYSSEEIERKSVSDLLKLLNSNALMKSSFPQITLLVLLVYTVPVSIDPVEILLGKRDFLV